MQTLPVLSAALRAPAVSLPGQPLAVFVDIQNNGQAQAENVSVQLTSPNVQTLPVFAVAEGASTSASLQGIAPAVSPRGAGEGEADYAARLASADGQFFGVAASLSWRNSSAANFGPMEETAQVRLALPRLSVSVAAPATAKPGDAISYSVSVTNAGSAEAQGIAATLRRPDNSTLPVSFPSTVLAPGATVSASVADTVPQNQPEGAYAAVVAASWADAAASSYGPVYAMGHTDISAPPVIPPPSWPQGASLTALATLSGAHLEWTAAEGEVAHYRIYRDGLLWATTPGNERVAEAVHLTRGQTYAFKVEAEGPSGQATQSGPSATFVSTPPSPVLVAPALDTTAITPFEEATAFLYTGENAIQTGVAASAIKSKQVAVVRGSVKAVDGTPLPGALVTILGHEELGRTYSRADGQYDMAVNGGGRVTVEVSRAGYFPVQRQMDVPWNDYASFPEVILTAMDSNATVVDMASSGFQVGQGSVTQDFRGQRQATVLFPPGNTARLSMPDGTTRTLSTLTFRATEYTVGERGPDAMPGELPPTTAYTYAVELSADEAIAAGAHDVIFEKPVFIYVDNFVGFPAGLQVPAGYYNRRKAAWEAEPDGHVIAVLSTSGGVAQIDTNGDGAADDASRLAQLGVTTGELQQLAGLYSPGKTLWRVPVMHFSPWDLNFPSYTVYAPYPELPPALAETPELDPCKVAGSIIECQNQTLGESLPIVGTSFTLNYRSDRVPGRKANYRINIPLTGPNPPKENFIGIVVHVWVAGQFHKIEYAPTTSPNVSVPFDWDGKDAYGRWVNGNAVASIGVGYKFQASLRAPAGGGRTFAMTVPGTAPGGTVGLPWNFHIITWQSFRVRLGWWSPPPSNLGGWFLSAQHTYSRGGNLLWLGTGDSRRAAPVRPVNTIAGKGTTSTGAINDNGPATEAYLRNPRGVAVAPDGTVYIADMVNNRIRKVTPEGFISTFAGTGQQGAYGNDDNGPATNAGLYLPEAVAVGPDGSVYISDTGHNRIRKVDTNGIITTVAGAGLYPGDVGSSGDEGPAILAKLNRPTALAVGKDGCIYFADTNNHRIRRVEPNGMIRTYAGAGNTNFGIRDGGPAIEGGLNHPQGVALDSQGNLYIADTFHVRVRKVTPEGIISTVAGTSIVGFGGDDVKAATSAIYWPLALTVGPDDSVYFAVQGVTSRDSERIQRISPDGMLTTVAGSGTQGFAGDGGSAAEAQFSNVAGMALSPDGSLYVADERNHRIRKIDMGISFVARSENFVTDASGRNIYSFDAQGRHVETVDVLTNTKRLKFNYDSAGRLASVEDPYGLALSVERDGNGSPTALVAPGGQRTVVTTDANGYLASLTNPAGERHELTHNAEGLLMGERDAKGNTHSFEYDAKGLLSKDTSPGGSFKQLARTRVAGGFGTELKTGMGKTTRYSIMNNLNGDQERVVQTPDGLQQKLRIGADGTRTATSPDGTVVTLVPGVDTRLGAIPSFASRQSITLPSGLTNTVTRKRTSVAGDASIPWDAQSLTDTSVVNGRNWVTNWTKATRQLSLTTPGGRQIRTTYDESGRVASVETPDLLPMDYAYTSTGQLASVTQGSRTSTFVYNPQRYMASATDPLSQSVSFGYDLAGRIN